MMSRGMRFKAHIHHPLMMSSRRLCAAAMTSSPTWPPCTVPTSAATTRSLRRQQHVPVSCCERRLAMRAQPSRLLCTTSTILSSTSSAVPAQMNLTAATTGTEMPVPREQHRDFRAAIFTPVGVLVRINKSGTRTVEGEQNIPAGSLAKVITADVKDTAIRRWTRGEWHAEDAAFHKALRADLRRYGPVYSDFDVRAIVGALLNMHQLTMSPAVTDALLCMKAEGMRLAVITAEGFLNAEKETRRPEPSSLFDVVVEPCREGLNKGSVDLYQLTLDRLGLTGDQCVYFDPYMKHNAIAESLGITAIPCGRLNFAQLFRPIVGYSMQGFVPGTVAVRNKEQLDVEALTEFLQRRLELPTNTACVAREFTFTHGVKSFHLRFGDDQFLLRTQLDGQIGAAEEPTRNIKYDFRLAQVLKKNHVVMPQPLVYCSDTSVLGRPFYVTEYAADEAICFARLPADHIATLCQTMALSQASLHRIDVKDNELDFVRKGVPLTQQLANWMSEYDVTRTHFIGALSMLVNRLRDCVAQVEKNAPFTLTFDNLRLEEMTTGTQSAPLFSVYECSEQVVIGNPYADLAHGFVDHFVHSKRSTIVEDNAEDVWALPGPDSTIPTTSEYLTWYSRYGGGSMDTIPDWDLYVAMAFLKKAVELQAVFYSAMTGQETDEEAYAAGEMVEYLAECGLRLTKDANDDF